MVLLPSHVGAVTTFVLLSLFINAMVVVLPISAKLGLEEDFFKQEENRLLPSRIDHLKEPRLLDLLKLRDTVSKLLDDSSVHNNGVEIISPEDTETENSSPRKRVFCNNFTGCGGRFRGRRRQQQPQGSVGKRLALKRPFCNSVGCYNSAKRFLYPTLPLESSRNDSHVKRLFCNGYGGCQNFGKRVLDQDEAMDDPKDQATAIDALELDLDETATKLKRFINGGFDKNMEDLLKNLKR